MKKCLMNTQYESDIVVTWENIAHELENNFEMDNSDFITLNFQGENEFIQSTPISEELFTVEVGNGLIGSELKLVCVQVTTVEEIEGYFKRFFESGNLPDTTGWKSAI